MAAVTRVGLAVVLAACAVTHTSGEPHTTSSEPCFYDCAREPAATATAGPPCFYDCARETTRSPAAASLPRKTLGKLGPAGEKVALLRTVADQLEQAAIALSAGNKYLAERLFSSAELLAPDELAALAPSFRDGAPPRVTTPLVQVDTHAAPQPIVAGSSEAEDEEAKVPPPIAVGKLSGSIQVDGKNLAGAFGLVTLEPDEGDWKPRTPKRHVIEQRGREFRPHVMAIAVGSTVVFPNFDPFFHNVFSRSPVAAFDLGIYKPGEAREYTFNREGILHLACNLHENMSAYIAVVSAPHYVVTDEAGRFAFKRLAPGKYTLRAWSERSRQPITQIVTVKVGSNEIMVGVRGDAPTGPQVDKFGATRSPDSRPAR